MRRRTFITLIGGVTAAWPLTAHSQTRALPVIGILSVTASDAPRNSIEAILRGLGKMGYAEGDTISIDYRWADGDYSRLPRLASELVSRGVSIIFANGSANVAKATKAATSTIPIVFANGGDPIKLGLVQSINRPGGNVTGVSFFFSALGSGHAELLAALAIRHQLPAVYEYHPFVAAGGLISYGGSVTDSYRLAGVYTGRILRGDKPAELPVLRSTKVELLLNLKTAKALGITVPLSLLGRADEVIE